MSVRLAEKTIKAIDDTLYADQGNRYRYFLRYTMAALDDAYRVEESSVRSHLGASQIGRKCAREIFYGFRWAKFGKVDARMLRLFNRGHLEEARFIALLLMIGCRVKQQDKHGKQYRISHHGGHFSGSGDGIVFDLPDLPKGSVSLCEFKTHSEKSFVKLQKDGLKIAKPEHYTQMCVYMYKMRLATGLYMAVNKNTDALYAEIVFANDDLAMEYIDRAERIIWLNEAPNKIAPSAGYFDCKFCDMKDICHMGAMPQRTCRSCDSVEIRRDGQWMCSQTGELLTKESQLAACDHYKLSRLFRT